MLENVQTVLLIDWPSREVPETLARAGFQVFVKGGPGPQDYSACEWINGEVVNRHTGRPPDRADLIYSYRPLSELPEIITLAKALHAGTIWSQSETAPEELQTARALVESAGLRYITEPYIVEAAREHSRRHGEAN